MQFLSAFYWQQARNENASGLLLQQYVCAGVCVHFSCVCRGRDGDDRAGGYMTERFLWWFRGLSLRRLTSKPEKALEEAEEGLSRLILRADDELAAAGPAGTGKTTLAGIFCVGEEFFFFCRGEQRIYLINTGFGRAHIGRLGVESGELFFQRGILQPDIGLLFAVAPFWEHITEQMIKEGLSVWEVMTEEQMRKHLNELGEEAQRQGGKDMAAVFVRTAEGIKIRAGRKDWNRKD